MIGAILGDIIGSPYEFDRGDKSREFPLFSGESTYTDDTVMTLAVAMAFIDAKPNASDDDILRALAHRMPDTEFCFQGGFKTLNAGPIAALATALQCGFLQWRGFMMT